MNFLQDQLAKRKEENAFRSLKVNEGMADFCSNDYLGFARSEELAELTEEEFRSHASTLPTGQTGPLSMAINGSTGSRLISGNSVYAEKLENDLAAFHYAEAGLLYNSGYDANIGLFSCIAKRGDTFICDEFIHASIIDGIILSRANILRFEHNNIADLKRLLKKTTGKIFVAVESIYSMDGDAAPLKQFVELCETHGANLIVDEAHATGIFGKEGRGLVNELGLEKEIFARVHTFGKALGVHGAIVLCSYELKEYLINFSRSFIYSTALPLHSLCAIRSAYALLTKSSKTIQKLNDLIGFFNEKIKIIDEKMIIPSNSAIHCILYPGNGKVKEIANYIQEKGFDVRPILHPTVTKGKERIRICLHAFNTEAEVNSLVNCLKS